jgi:DNA modification methylase
LALITNSFSNVSNKDPNYISYDYFCITTEELKLSHQPTFDDLMPLCTATKYNYYEFFGLKETSYSVENIAKHIVDAARKGNNEACIKYSTQAAYQTAVTRLFRQSEIFEALRIASRYVKNLETKETKYHKNIFIYNIGSGSSEETENHPAPYPEQLAYDQIITWSNQNDVVLDPFMGSGTTAKMCLKTNRKYIGFEISKEYCDIAQRRVQDISYQINLFDLTEDHR